MGSEALDFRGSEREAGAESQRVERPGAARLSGGMVPALAGVLLVASALLAAPLLGHIDDTDAQLYQVLSRHLAERGEWIEAGPAPGSLGPFREHLPFGLWPFAAATRLLGEGAQPFCALAFSLGTLALVLWLGTRLASLRAGVVAALLLACNDTFFLYGARARLDPLLMLLSFGSAAVVLVGAPMRFAALFGICAAIVKGPFGLVPLAAVGTARAIVERRPRIFAATVAAILATLVPVLAFLLWDRAHGGSWWNGWARDQLFASGIGIRRDGEIAPSFPLRTLAGRFWPGLPFVLLGAAQALRLPLPPRLRPSPRAARSLAVVVLACALGIGMLCLPVRKVWNHALVLYPLLALAGGLSLDALVERLPRRVARLALPVLAALAWAAFALGLGPRLLQPPCVMSREFRPQLSALAPGTPILLIGATPDWTTLAGLEAEHRLSPWLSKALPEGAASDEPGRAGERARAGYALSPPDAGPSRAPWLEIAHARGWRLLRR